MRILEWIIERAHGRAYAKETVVGWMPRADDINLDGIPNLREQFKQMQEINLADIKSELIGQEELFLKLAGDLPKEMIFQRELLISRL